MHWIFRDGESRHLDEISEADGRNPAAIGIYGKDDILLIKSCSDFPSTAVTGRWFRPWNTWLGYHFIPFIKRIKSPELRVTTSGHSVFPHDGIISCRIQSLKEIFICGKNQWRSCSPLKKNRRTVFASNATRATLTWATRNSDVGQTKRTLTSNLTCKWPFQSGDEFPLAWYVVSTCHDRWRV